jgi:Uma2 family endonuclease
MSTSAPEKLMTVEEFLALPEDDGVERMLIRGKLWEKPMTKRNRFHSITEATIAMLLGIWSRSQPEPRGAVCSGEAGFLLRRDPDTTFGIDVAYISAETAAAQSDTTTLIDGVPVLAVEILSPNDTQQEVLAKVRDYLAAGVSLVWLVDPYFRTVTVHRPDQGPEMFHGEDELLGDPHLPGFCVKVAEIFA